MLPMATQRWSIETSGEHSVEVHTGTHSARVRTAVDGQTVFSQDGRAPLWDIGFHHEFDIDGKPYRLTIHRIGSAPAYDLQMVRQ